MAEAKAISANKPTATIEDYLGAIYILERDGEPVIGARLAELLQVSAPTVTVTLRRMARDGWITSDEKKEIHLTLEGQDMASTVIRRHMLAEWMLTRLLNMSWSQVHGEADKFEHSISSDIEERLRDQMDDPQTCPHGNPLPGYEDVTAHWLPLVKVPVGRRIIIRRVHEHAEDDPELMQFLETHHILPGIEATVCEKLSSNQTICLEREGETLALGMPIVGYIYVELVETEA